MAQSDSVQGSDAEADGNTEQTRSENVYTMEDLNRLAQNEASPAVYTNESLSEEPAEATPASAEAYTNRDLNQRFGNEDLSQADDDSAMDEGVGEAETPETETEPEEPAQAEPSMSPEERAGHIAEIDDELERLERRLLAITNPLLAGTEKPTADEAGLDNIERLHRTEEKIEELKQALEDLGDQ